MENQFSVTWDRAPQQQQFGQMNWTCEGIITALKSGKEYRILAYASRGFLSPDIGLLYLAGKVRGRNVSPGMIKPVWLAARQAWKDLLKPLRAALMLKAEEDSQAMWDSSIAAQKAETVSKQSPAARRKSAMGRYFKPTRSPYDDNGNIERVHFLRWLAKAHDERVAAFDSSFFAEYCESADDRELSRLQFGAHKAEARSRYTHARFQRLAMEQRNFSIPGVPKSLRQLIEITACPANIVLSYNPKNSYLCNVLHHAKGWYWHYEAIAPDGAKLSGVMHGPFETRAETLAQWPL